VLACNEFRLLDIVDLETNKVVYQLEHEIRYEQISFCILFSCMLRIYVTLVSFVVLAVGLLSIFTCIINLCNFCVVFIAPDRWTTLRSAAHGCYTKNKVQRTCNAHSCFPWEPFL